MKILKTILNPMVLVLSFLLIVISGEHTGGFYITYLRRALPQGALYAVLAILGIILLLANLYRPVGNTFLFKPVLNQVGGFLLLMSLCVFFISDPTGYNMGTFSQGIPLITIVIFLLLVVGFIYKNFVASIRRKPRQ